MPGDPLQPSQDVVDVRAEDAAVDVQLVQHDPAQVAQERLPILMVREDAGVQHVGVGDQRLRRVGADLLAAGARRVAVVDLEARRVERAQPAGEPAQAAELILRQRLGRVEEECFRARILEDALERAGGEQQGLAGSGRRDRDDVLAGAGQVDALGLVAVEPLDALLAECFGENPRQRTGELAVHGGDTFDPALMGDHPPERRVFEQLLEDPVHRGGAMVTRKLGKSAIIALRWRSTPIRRSSG
jgi:hypothetical protein